MRIIFDLRVAQILLQRGIGRYISGLFSEMVENKDLEISVLLSKNLQYPDFIDKYSNKINVYSLENFDSYYIKENFDFFFSGCFFVMEGLAQNKFDIIDVTFPQNVIKYCNQISGILYDFIPLDYAGVFFRNNEEWAIKYSIQFDSLKIVKHFFTISNFTKESGEKYSGRPSSDFTNIYAGVDLNKFNMNNISEASYKIKERTTNIVDISGDTEGKNYKNLVKGFALAYKNKKIPKDSKLYIICDSAPNFKERIQDILNEYGLKVGKHVFPTGYIPDSEIFNIVSKARALVHTAYVEGFGMPIAEAYAMGTPVFSSNCSAMKELILPECSFNPASVEDISNKIIELYNNEELCQKSLNFGKKLLKEINWENASNKVVSKLNELKNNFKKKDRIAVFIPGNGAIAEYTVRFHLTMPNDFDVFADTNNLSDFDRLQSLKKGRVSNTIPFINYEDSKLFSNHIAKIFVLGNSPHHANSLNEAIKTKGEKNRYLLLHEPLMFGAFWNMLNNGKDIKKTILEWYPNMHSKIEEFDKIGLYDFCRKYNIYLIRPLINLTGISDIIALNDKCSELILKELNENEKKIVKIKTIFLPYEKLNNIAKIDLKQNKDIYIVGTFGHPSLTKQTLDIVKAIDILNKQGIKVKLLIAGPGVDKFLDSYNINRKNLIVKENPPTSDWLPLLNSVDLGIELRPNSHTNSSGCVSELTGLGKEVLLTENFVQDDLKKYFHFATENVSQNDLAEIIKNILLKKEKKMQNNDGIFNKYSFESLSRKIKDIIINNK